MYCLKLDAFAALQPKGVGGSTRYNGQYEKAPPERGTFFRLEVYKKVGISRVEVLKRAGKLSLRY